MVSNERIVSNHLHGKLGGKKQLNHCGNFALKKKPAFSLICNIYKYSFQIVFGMQMLFTLCHCHLSVPITIS